LNLEPGVSLRGPGCFVDESGLFLSSIDIHLTVVFMNGVQSDFLHLVLFNAATAETVKSQNSQLTAAVREQTVSATDHTDIQNAADNLASQTN